jgi:hypothetical protein
MSAAKLVSVVSLLLPCVIVTGRSVFGRSVKQGVFK